MATGQARQENSHYIDMIKDPQYLYVVSSNNIASRLRYSDLQHDNNWLITYNEDAWFRMKGIYLRGDTAYITGRNETFSPYYNSILAVHKTTRLKRYRLLSNSTSFRAGEIHHIVFKNDSIVYIKGDFILSNGIKRNHFLSMNIQTGRILNWYPTFQDNDVPYSNDFGRPSWLYRLEDNKIWFALPSYYKMSNGDNFYGFGAIDTNGILLPPFFRLSENVPAYFSYIVRSIVTEMIRENDYVYVAGNFDLVDAHLSRNLAKIPTKTIPATVPDISSEITGAPGILINSDSTKYYISGADLSLYSYQWSYSGSDVEIRNNGYDTVWLVPGPNATPGTLQVRPLSYCAYGNPVQIVLAVGSPDLTITGLAANPASIPTGSNFTVSFKENNSGGIQAASNKVYFYLSTDNTLNTGTGGDLLLGEYSITDPLAATTATALLNKQLSIPCGRTPGNYFLIAVADAAAIVAESNETNNNTVIPVTIITGAVMPDIPGITVTPFAAVCAGSPVTMTASSANCPTCTYSWNTGASGASLTITPPVGINSYTVTATNSCGIASKSQTIYSTAIPNVTTTVTGTLCGGNTITLNANGATEYTWTGPGLVSTTGSSVTAVLPASGTADYTVTGTTLFCPQTATRTITVLSDLTPEVNIDFSGCSTSLLTFTANPVNGGSTPGYQWYINGASSGTGTTLLMANASVGTTYEIRLSMLSSTPCATIRTVHDTLSVNCSATAVPDINGLEEYMVTPNPSTGMINLKMKLTQLRPVTISIFNINGQKVLPDASFSASGNIVKPLDIRHLPAGMYFLKITIAKEFFVDKIMKQ